MTNVVFFLLGSTSLPSRRKHLRECRKMCLHARELPCEAIGRVATRVSALIDLDDIGSQEHTHLLFHVLSHDGVRRRISTIFLDYHLGGDG